MNTLITTTERGAQALLAKWALILTLIEHEDGDRWGTWHEAVITAGRELREAGITDPRAELAAKLRELAAVYAPTTDPSPDLRMLARTVASAINLAGAPWSQLETAVLGLQHRADRELFKAVCLRLGIDPDEALVTPEPDADAWYLRWAWSFVPYWEWSRPELDPATELGDLL